MLTGMGWAEVLGLPPTVLETYVDVIAEREKVT